MLLSKKRRKLLWLLEIYCEDEGYSVEYIRAEEEVFMVVDEFDWKNARVIRLVKDKLFWSLREDKEDTKRNNKIIEHDIKLKLYERVYPFLYVIILILLNFNTSYYLLKYT